MIQLARFLGFLSILGLAAGSPAGVAQDAAKPGKADGAIPVEETYKPVPFMPGRDVVWVPTPDVLVESMLDLAKLTPEDVAVDLGSGDGRMVIAAALRGATARGIEFNPDMVKLAQQRAAKAGVADRATFVEDNMFEADFSDATVMPLFLLPENLNPLVPKFLNLKAGSRIVINEYRMDEWEPDRTVKIGGDCGRWCVAHLYVVPAKVNGLWRLEDGRELRLNQTFQTVLGSMSERGQAFPIENARLDGPMLHFLLNGKTYSGRVDGETITGQVEGEPKSSWRAKRL